MKLQAQRYRHRIGIEQKVQVQDPVTLDIDHSWQTVALDSDHDLDAVPAEVLLGPGREFNGADAKQAETTARIAFRWFPGLTQAMRITWEGRVFDILSIETDATARREYRVRCKDGVTDGA